MLECNKNQQNKRWKAEDGERKQKHGSAAGADVKDGRSHQTHAVYIPCMYDYWLLLTHFISFTVGIIWDKTPPGVLRKSWTCSSISAHLDLLTMSYCLLSEAGATWRNTDLYVQKRSHIITYLLKNLLKEPMNYWWRQAKLQWNP